MKIQPLIALLFASSNLPSAQVSLFEGRPGQSGNVVVVAHSELRPAELQGIVLLPLDCAGRTQLTELLEGQTRLRTDVPQAARLLLPGERGSLYKYQRPVAGGALFGFFLVRPSGMATSLFELAGSGTAGTVDPFVGNLAIEADGRAFLVASSVAAGGDLWEVSLVGTAVNRTPQIAPRDFRKNGLVLFGTWGLGVATDGVYRFDRALGANASAVTLPFTPPWFGPDVVGSADESTVAFLAGADVSQARVLTCRRLGHAVMASDRAMNIPGAGFLPEDHTGPALALSTDGSWVIWRGSGGGGSQECFARETRSGPRAPSQHLTGPTHFDNTLNDTGVIAFFGRESAVMAVGRDQSNGIGRGDIYRVDLNALTGFTATNLSLTSGITAPPFDYGMLDTGDGLYQVPGLAPAFLAFVGAGTGSMLWVDGAGGVVPILDRVQSLDSIDVTGSFLVAGVTRPPGVDDPLLESLNLVQIPSGGLGAIRVRLPFGCHLTRTVGSHSDNVFAAVLEFQTGERLGRIRVPSPSGISVSPSLLEFGPTTGLSDQGAILATVELARERAAFSWSDVGTSVLRFNRVESFLLPGL